LEPGTLEHKRPTVAIVATRQVSPATPNAEADESPGGVLASHHHHKHFCSSECRWESLKSLKSLFLPVLEISQGKIAWGPRNKLFKLFRLTSRVFSVCVLVMACSVGLPGD
jgi:hypothetical protein